MVLRLRGVIREICRANDIEILKGHVRPDYIHLLLSVPPNLQATSVAKRTHPLWAMVVQPAD